jgi:superfamily II DNA/RNA helicase
MASATGSGKTMAYVLPVVQAMIMEEQSGYSRMVSSIDISLE